MGMLAGVTDCRRSWKWGCRGRWALGFKPRHGSHSERGPHGFEGVRRVDHVVLGEKEETTRLQSKWGGDHAALKEGVNHEALKHVDR